MSVSSEAERPWQPSPGGLELRVRVTPRGGRDTIDGIETLSDGRRVLKIRVRVAPEGGAANDAVRKLLAKSVKCPASAVSLKSGATARLKVFNIAGDAAALSDILMGLV